MKKKNNIKRAIISIIIYFIFGIMAFPSNENISNFNSLYYILLAVFTSIILFYLYKKEIVEEFKSFIKKPLKNILVCVLIFILCFLIIVIGNNITYLITNIKEAKTLTLVFPNMKNFLFYTIFVMIIYTPFVESIIFNKALNCIFKNKVLFTLVSGIIFGIMQVGINIHNLISIITTIPYMLIGMIVSLLYVKKKNIFYPLFTWIIYYAFQLLVQSSVYWT